MIFSKSTEYATRVLVYLVINSGEKKKIGVQKLASVLEFPEHYLGKILQTLAKNGLVASAKGPNGGFFATQKTGSLTLLSVVDLFDGLRFFDTCGLGLHECNEDRPCPIHKEYQIVKGNLYKLLSDKTIDMMKEDIESGIAFMRFQANEAALP